jgi:hypothetical protein
MGRFALYYMYDIIPKDNSILLLLFSPWKQKNDAGKNHRFFKFLKCITSYYRYCNLQRNSEALKAKKDTHTYAHIHEHTPHEEHWHTYAHIHEHTLTQHMKNIGTYTTHTHSCERVLAGIHHAYSKYTFSHTRYTTHKKNSKTQAHTHSHTQKNNTLWQKKHVPSGRWLVQVGSQL